MSTRRLAILERSRRYRILLFLIIFSWLLVGLTVFFVDPDSLKDILIPGSYLPMAVLLFIALFFLFSLLLLSAKHAFVWSTMIILYLYLRLWGLSNIFTAISIFGLLATLELYTHTHHPPTTPQSP